MAKSINTIRLTFEKDKIYNLVFLKVKDGKSMLIEDYLQKAVKICKPYGGQLIASFEVIDTRSKHMSPNSVRIFEWSDSKSRNEAFSSEAFIEIKPLREVALSEMKIGFFGVEETHIVHLDTNKIYEIVGLSLLSETNSTFDIERYYNIPEPHQRIIGDTIPKVIISFNPINSNREATYEHQMQFIVERSIATEHTKLLANKKDKIESNPFVMNLIKESDIFITKILPN